MRPDQRQLVAIQNHAMERSKAAMLRHCGCSCLAATSCRIKNLELWPDCQTASEMVFLRCTWRYDTVYCSIFEQSRYGMDHHQAIVATFRVAKHKFPAVE